MSDQSSQKPRMNSLMVVLILSGVFFAIFLLVSGALYVGKFSEESRGKPSRAIFRNEAVAVVELNGVILDSKKTLKRLDRAEDDPSVKAVVLRLNSPGGAVAPSQEIYERVKNFKKPVVASMASVAASGAFYIACAAKEVFANPGTITGSIGVIMEFANLEKLYEWAKIKRFSIKTGRFKDSGAEYREMTPEDRALLQGMVDDVLVQFKQAVSTGRKIPPEELEKIADGRVLSGHQAHEAKLVDRLGTIDDAIQAAAKLGAISGKPKVVYPDEPKKKLIDFLLDTSRDAESESEAQSQVSGFGVEKGIENWVRQVVSGAAGKTSPMEEMSPGIYWIWRGAR